MSGNRFTVSTFRVDFRSEWLSPNQLAETTLTTSNYRSNTRIPQLLTRSEIGPSTIIMTRLLDLYTQISCGIHETGVSTVSIQCNEPLHITPETFT